MAVKIEMKIAKNGSKRYYVRNENGKLSQISREKVIKLAELNNAREAAKKAVAENTDNDEIPAEKNTVEETEQAIEETAEEVAAEEKIEVTAIEAKIARNGAINFTENGKKIAAKKLLADLLHKYGLTDFPATAILKAAVYFGRLNIGVDKVQAPRTSENFWKFFECKADRDYSKTADFLADVADFNRNYNAGVHDDDKQIRRQIWFGNGKAGKTLADKRADEAAIDAASKNIVEKCNSELGADPNAEHPAMARYLTTVAYKPEWQETIWPVKCFAIRSTDFARAEKALNIIKTSLTGLPIEFDEEPCIKVFDKWEDEFVPVYYVEETDGSEDDMDDEEIFDVTPADENDAEDELIDEAAEIVANVESAASEINSELTLTSNNTPKIKVDRNANFKAGFKKQTIGVEIEFTGITRKAAAKAIAALFETSAYYVGDEYGTWAIEDKRRRTWRVMFDSSLISQRENDDGYLVGANDNYRCELVTPILRWNDIATLQSVAEAIVAAGGFVNKSCGLHVHIGGDGFTAQALRNLVNIVGSRENLFYEAFAVDNYRKDFCRPTDKGIIREFNENKPSTLDEVKEIWYNGRTGRANYRYDNSRYTIANLHSFFNKGTVEFRLFNSTLDAEEIAAAIHFSAALADMAKRKSRTTYEVLTDRPFERMRHFLGRLKLTGDEFKTTRYHILKHLTGGKAGQTAVA